MLLVPKEIVCLLLLWTLELDLGMIQLQALTWNFLDWWNSQAYGYFPTFFVLCIFFFLFNGDSLSK